MAFVCRAGRDTALAAPGSTTNQVGPGSYGAMETRSVMPSVVPFSSSSKRPCAPDSSTISNATGSSSASSAAGAGTIASRSQDSTWDQQQQHRGNSSSSFASSTQRFQTSKEAAAKPGPGAYQTAPNWKQPVHSQSGQSPPGGRGNASSKVAELLSATAAAGAAALHATSTHTHGTPGVFVLTPPSIPARHQSFGYEKGPGGLLLMQQPQPSGGTATGGTGPAAHAGKKGTAWAASRVNRWEHFGKRQASTLQPLQQLQQEQQRSAYKGSTTDWEWASKAGKGSAAFMSKVPKPHQQEADYERATPGPGAYQQQIATTARPYSAPAAAIAAGFRASCSQAQPQQPHQQLFGRTAGREGLVPSLSTAAATGPGPGTYDVTASGALARVVQGLSSGTQPGGSGFGSTSNRFNAADSCTPGPGRYSADQVVSLSTEAARRAATASKRGAFNTATERFGTGQPAGALERSFQGVLAAAAVGPSADDLPGPGQYNVDYGGLTRKAAAAAVRPSAGFISATKRFEAIAAPRAKPNCSCWDGSPSNLRGDAARLGPGAYMQQDEWIGKQSGHAKGAGACTGSMQHSSSKHLGYHKAAFGRKASRSSPSGAHNSHTPGPGAYSNATKDMKEVFRPLNVPGSNRAGFSAGSQRFSSSETAPPGPGRYCADAANSCSMIRPSFNVTLDV